MLTINVFDLCISLVSYCLLLITIVSFVFENDYNAISFDVSDYSVIFVNRAERSPRKKSLGGEKSFSYLIYPFERIKKNSFPAVDPGLHVNRISISCSSSKACWEGCTYKVQVRHPNEPQLLINMGVLSVRAADDQQKHEEEMLLPSVSESAQRH